MANVTCYGGAGMVTGSCHLLEIRSIKILDFLQNCKKSINRLWETTLDIAYIVLLDSAMLLQEEYETQIRKAQRRGEEHPNPPKTDH